MASGPVLVTGGAQGIGREIARELLAERRPVVVLDLDPDAADAFRHAHGGASVEVVVGDVAVEAHVKHAVTVAVERFGGLAGVVNNAGIGIGGPIATLTLDAWNRVLAVNLTGAFLTAKHAAPHLREAKGAIVNVASTRALMSEPDTEAYAASKGGLVALTHALAASLGPDVRVNAVSPGWIHLRRSDGAGAASELRAVDHEQHPVGRVGRPQDVAAAVTWLLSDRAAFVTGQNIVVDGGMTRKMIYAP